VGKLTFTTVRAQNLTATTRPFLGDPSWATQV
jgi:hypothetical protein